jgi:hypothetical protein
MPPTGAWLTSCHWRDRPEATPATKVNSGQAAPGLAVDPVPGEVPFNPGAIPDVSSAAPAPAAPSATAREVLEVPSHPVEGVQRHIEYLLTPRSRPRPA